jgi:predicted Zn-dependent protease
MPEEPPIRTTLRAIGRGGLGLLLLLWTLWGCSAPPSRPVARPLPPSAPTPAPDAPPAPRPTTPAMLASAQWVEAAVRAVDAGDYDRATALLERAISVEPNNGRAFYYYGLAMGERGQPGAALNLLRKAEILLRGDRQALADVYAQMGLNHERLGRRREALRWYEQALAQDPAQALARRRLQALGG